MILRANLLCPIVSLKRSMENNQGNLRVNDLLMSWERVTYAAGTSYLCRRWNEPLISWERVTYIVGTSYACRGNGLLNCWNELLTYSHDLLTRSHALLFIPTHNYHVPTT